MTSLVRAGELRADGRRETEAHGAGAAGGEPVVGFVVLVKLRRPHLVLADVGGDDRLAAGELIEFVDHLLHAQAALLLVGERVFLLVAVQLGEPLGGVERADAWQDRERRLGIADDLDVRRSSCPSPRGRCRCG
jgi:hypothetical protein